jgi:hypothetical protein
MPMALKCKGQASEFRHGPSNCEYPSYDDGQRGGASSNGHHNIQQASTYHKLKIILAFLGLTPSANIVQARRVKY